MPLPNKVYFPPNPDSPGPKGEASGFARALQQSLERQFGASEFKTNRWEFKPRQRRILKSAAGLAFIAAFAIQPLRLFMETGSAEAVVNAPLLTLRAPIDGVVSFDGASVILKDARAESGKIDEAARALARSHDERRSLERHRKAAVEELQRQTNQLELFRKGRVDQLEARLLDFDHRIAIADLQSEEAADHADRAAKLAGGSISLVEVEHARRSLAIAKESALANRAQREQTRIELEAARVGTFLGDGYNDVPSSAQKADELRRHIADIDADIVSSDETIARLRNDFDAENLQFEHLSKAVVAPPPGGRLWERLALPGENVRRGQDLARYLDCSTPIVTAAVGESAYNSLVIGQPARFLAADGVEVVGRVVNLTGPSGAGANLAIAPAALTKAAFRVSVSVPATGDDCGIGRTGRLVFGKRQ